MWGDGVAGRLSLSRWAGLAFAGCVRDGFGMVQLSAGGGKSDGDTGLRLNEYRPAGPAPESVIQSTLNSARRHLGMKMAYISRVDGDKSHLVYVDAPGFEAAMHPGSVRDVSEVYCQHILDGRVPQLLPDAACHPVTRDMQITHLLPVGAHISVPIRTREGEFSFLFCCLDTEPNSSLNARDIGVVRLFAEIAGAQIAQQEEHEHQTRQRIETLIARKQFSIAYQPLWNITNARILGFECLARFPTDPERDPYSWFEEAESVGLLAELELALIEAALTSAKIFPEDVRLSINVSAGTILHPRFADTLLAFDVSRLIIELTEHAQISDYGAVRAALDPLRTFGVRVALDDAGSGCAGLQHILGVNADFIKLDRSLVDSLHDSPVSRPMIAALRYFAHQTDAVIIAEGVETREEFDALRALGIKYAQGFFLGKPVGFKLSRELLMRAGANGMEV